MFFLNQRIKVQTRKIYWRKAVLAAVDKYGKNYQDLNHVLAEWEIDCFEGKFKLCSAIYYSKENDVIDRYHAAKEDCLTAEDIPPIQPWNCCGKGFADKWFEYGSL